MLTYGLRKSARFKHTVISSKYFWEVCHTNFITCSGKPRNPSHITQNCSKWVNGINKKQDNIPDHQLITYNSCHRFPTWETQRGMFIKCILVNESLALSRITGNMVLWIFHTTFNQNSSSSLNSCTLLNWEHSCESYACCTIYFLEIIVLPFNMTPVQHFYCLW